MKTFVAVLATSLLVSPAFAQSSSGASSSGTGAGLSDRFQIDTGYFDLKLDTTLRYNGPQASGDVSLEKDLGLTKNVNTFWVDATWRVGRRHQLKLAYTKFSRDRASYTLGRDFVWGGQTYNAGLRRRRRPAATSSVVTTVSPPTATTASRSARPSASGTSG